MERDKGPRRDRKLAASGLIAGLLAGGTAGLIIGTPIFASAEDGSAATTTSSSVVPGASAQTNETPSADEGAPTTGPSTTMPPDTTVAGEPDATTPVPTAPARKGTTETAGKPDRDATGERRSNRSQRLRSTLDALVEKGTITRAQADAVMKAIEDSMRGQRDGRWKDRIGSDHSGGSHGLGRSFGSLKAAYEALGMSPAELGKQLMEGKTLAEIARSRNVDPQVLIDAAVGPVKERLDAAVAEGRTTRERADEKLDRVTAAVTRMVNEGLGASFNKKHRD